MRRALLLLCLLSPCFASAAENTDVVVYAGSSAGVAAAIQAARMGKHVILIEPSQFLGGLTTGGLGATDIGNKKAIGGISREFYAQIREFYDNPKNWSRESREEYFSMRTRSSGNEDAQWGISDSALSARRYVGAAA